eukprot:6247692-Pyramimonas_sp.AAC.1
MLLEILSISAPHVWAALIFGRAAPFLEGSEALLRRQEVFREILRAQLCDAVRQLERKSLH